MNCFAVTVSLFVLVALLQGVRSQNKYPGKISFSDLTSDGALVSWPTSTSGQVVSYQIEIYSGSELVMGMTVLPPATQQRVTGLKPGTPYLVKVICNYLNGPSVTKTAEYMLVLPSTAAGVTGVGETVSTCGRDTDSPADSPADKADDTTPEQSEAGVITEIVGQGTDGSLQVEVQLKSGKKKIYNMAKQCPAKPSV